MNPKAFKAFSFEVPEIEYILAWISGVIIPLKPEFTRLFHLKFRKLKIFFLQAMGLNPFKA